MSNGITLIALVITIIVLLILAGVSISLLTGENGILSQATKAKEETRGASVEEAKDLWKYEQTLDDATNSSTAKTLDELLQELKSQGLLTDEEVATIKETGEITIGSKTIVFGTSADTLVAMFQNAQTAGCTNEDGSCKDETHLHIGDYVDYKPQSGSITLSKADTGYAEDQTYSVDTTTTWRVLVTDENGRILLISGSPIKKNEEDPYFIMQGAEAYINCVSTLNKVCGIYNNPSLAEETRSITTEDINRVGGITVANNKVYKTDDPTQTNIDEMGFLGNSYTYKSGDYAPENYMNDVYKTSVVRKKVGDEVNFDSYGYTYESLGVNTRIYNMLFAETTSEDKYAKSYWLASPGSYEDDSNANFGPGAVNDGNVYRGNNNTFNSNGNWNANRMSVRPVASIHCGYAINGCIRDNIETNYVL